MQTVHTHTHTKNRNSVVVGVSLLGTCLLLSCYLGNFLEIQCTGVVGAHNLAEVDIGFLGVVDHLHMIVIRDRELSPMPILGVLPTRNGLVKLTFLSLLPNCGKDQQI